MIRAVSNSIVDPSVIAFVRDHSAVLLALIAPVTAWILNFYFRPKVRLQHGVGHDFTYILDKSYNPPDPNNRIPSGVMHVRSTVVSNIGRETAKGVEVIINFPPDLINVWPIRFFERKDMADARIVLSFPNLAKSELFTVQMFTLNRKLPEVLNVRCEQGVSRLRNLVPQTVNSRTYNLSIVSLTTIGSGALIYLFIAFLRFIIGA